MKKHFIFYSQKIWMLPNGVQLTSAFLVDFRFDVEFEERFLEKMKLKVILSWFQYQKL